MITTAVAVLALVVALAALALAIGVTRQSAGLAQLLQRHRLGHQKREGELDPAPHTERRQLNLGPPRSTGERRVSPGYVLPPEESGRLARHAEEPDAAEDTGPVVGAPTVESPAARPKPLPGLPRPGQIGRR